MAHLESIQCGPDLSMHRCFVTGLAEETELVRGPLKTLDCTNTDLALSKGTLLQTGTTVSKLKEHFAGPKLMLVCFT